MGTSSAQPAGRALTGRTILSEDDYLPKTVAAPGLKNRGVPGQGSAAEACLEARHEDQAQATVDHLGKETTPTDARCLALWIGTASLGVCYARRHVAHHETDDACRPIAGPWTRPPPHWPTTDDRIPDTFPLPVPDLPVDTNICVARRLSRSVCGPYGLTKLDCIQQGTLQAD